MRKQRPRVFSADFETTVYAGQERTDVWAAAIVELYTEDVKIFGSIDALFEYLVELKTNAIVYFHNLKFDGAFWLSFLYEKSDYKEASSKPNEKTTEVEWDKNFRMKSGTFKYVISDMGQWYSITIKSGKYFIEIRDSLKLLPFTVKKIGKDFKTKHQKLSMKYDGYRYPNCPISDEEKEYIANDVLVVKEALEIMYNEGHTETTIGACCLKEYKYKHCPFMNYEDAFPNLYEISIDEETFGAKTIGEYIRRSYRGGWCYLVKGKENKIYNDGVTADVNSLYPSMMHSESGNYYPIGLPTFWIGDIPEEVMSKSKTTSPYHQQSIFYFLRVKTCFKLKTGYLPFIQIKGDRIHYRGNECLTSSDYYSRIDHKYHSTRVTVDGKLEKATVILTLTQTDWELIQEHYNLTDTEILDGCYFRAVKGIFDEYIDKYRQMKIESKGAKRQIAKLFLNNLYGKLAMNTDNSFKVAFLREDGRLGYYTVDSHDKKPGYIPCGTAITSYARNFTIRAAQKNFYGVNRPGFIYADTDSIHCDLDPEDIKGITVHPANFCCWKLESSWDEAIFIRQKAYAEHVIANDLEPIDKPYWEMKCAGMPERSKLLFLSSIGDEEAKERLQKFLQDNDTELNETEEKFLSEKRTILDYKIGLEVPGKLLPKNIPGGIILVDTPYKMRETFR